MFKKLLLSTFLSFWTASSQAALLTWNLADVVFDDGAIATGTFVFDADAFAANDWQNFVPDWNISVSGGDESVFPAFTYNPTTAPDTVGVFLHAYGGYEVTFWIDGSAPGGTPESRTLVLVTEAPLTNSGGTIMLVPGEFYAGGSRECYNCDPYRSIVSGGSLNAVPIPAAIWLFGSGIIGLIGVARRKKS